MKPLLPNIKPIPQRTPQAATFFTSMIRTWGYVKNLKYGYSADMDPKTTDFIWSKYLLRASQQADKQVNNFPHWD